MNKIGIIATTTTLLLALTCAPAFAMGSIEKETNMHIASNSVINTKNMQYKYMQNTGTMGSPSAQKGRQFTDRLNNLGNRAEKEIGRRVFSLNSLIGEVNQVKRLTDAQKSTMRDDIQSEITNLNALGAKIATDTDVTTYRADVKSIVDSYRIYLLYLPQTRIIITSDSLLDAQSQFSVLVTKLQSRITEAQGKGNDIASLQTLLTDMQAKLADAQTQAQNAMTTVQGLQPTGYPGNKTELQTANQDLKTASQHIDSQKGEQDLSSNPIMPKTINRMPKPMR